VTVIAIKVTPQGGSPALPASLVATIIAAVLLTAACQGKGVAGSCSDVAGCGGNLVGTWTVSGFCQYLVNAASTNGPLPAGYTTPQTPSLSTTPAPEVTTGDWCQGLDILPTDGGIMIANTNFFAPPSQFASGTVQFKDDQTYTFNLTSVAQVTEHLSRACIQAHGASPTCKGLEEALLAVPNPNYSDLHCNDATDGCDCSLQLGDSGFDTGTWALDQSLSVVYESSGTPGKSPQAATYCVNGSDLTLSGYDGATLAGGPAGLRTLKATRTGP
jgi:hypothetical protein